MNKSIICFLLFGWVLIATSCNQHKGDGLLSYKNADGKNILVKNKVDWEKKRQQILDSMQAAMGKLPGRHNLPPFDVQFIDSLQFKSYTRYSIHFLVAPNERLSAYLHIPRKQKANQKFPAIIALHETDSIGKRSVDGQGSNKNLAYAKSKQIVEPRRV